MTRRQRERRGARLLWSTAVHAAGRLTVRVASRWPRCHRLAAADEALTGYVALIVAGAAVYPLVLWASRGATALLGASWLAAAPAPVLLVVAVVVPLLLVVVVTFTVLPVAAGVAAITRAGRLVRRRRALNCEAGQRTTRARGRP